jgi:methionyl-tRNA formyltransferase
LRSFFQGVPREDIRIDWRWAAEELDRLVRAQSSVYPQAFCFHRGGRLEIVAATVSEAVYGGTPGRIFYREGDGVAVVAGADARRGRN